MSRIDKPGRPPPRLTARDTGLLGARLFLVVALVAAFVDLGARSLHVADTARWGQLAREMIRSGQWLVPTRYGEIYANKPVLYLWAVAAPSALCGEVTPFLVRLPSALGLLLMAFTTAWWAGFRTGSKGVGRTAGLLLLSTFAVAWQGREGRLDMMGSGLSVAAAALLDRTALGLGTRRTPWAAGLLLGAALLVKGPPLLLVPLAVLFVPSARGGLRVRLRNARPGIVLGTAFLVALAWFVPAVLQGGSDYGRALLFSQASERLSGRGNHLEAPWYYLLGLPLTMAPWGLAYLLVFLAAWLPRTRRTFGSLGGLALAGGLVLLFFSAVPTKHYRYLAPVMPLFAMPLAAWIHIWLTSVPRIRWRPHLAVLALVLAVLALGLLTATALAPALSGTPQILQRLATFLPPFLLLPLALWLWRGRRLADEPRLRAQFVVALLLAAVLLMTAQATLRPRFHPGNKERFNQRLAVFVAGQVPVLIVPPLTPENVFHGAPDARYPYTAGSKLPIEPGSQALVLCRAEHVQAVLEADPENGQVLMPADEEYGRAIVGFGFP